MANTIAPEFEYQILASGFDHVEGICWDPTRHCLWAGGEAGQIYRVGLDGETSITTTIQGGVLLGLALDARGDLYVCDPGNHQVWRVSAEGTYEPFGDPIDYPNYASFSTDGRLYVSDSGSFDEATGQLFVIDPDGTTTNVSPRPLSFSNGLCVDGSTLWLVESSAPGVSAMDLGGGPLDLTIPMERCVPDGLALDVRGGLLISCYQPNQLWRWTKGEGLHLLFEDWTGEYVLSPTNVAFYGERLDRLALASLCGHNLVTIRPPHPGAALIYPDLQSENT